MGHEVIEGVTEWAAGAKAGFVFIWDTDLVDIITMGVDGTRTGIFNVAGSGSVSTSEVARVMGATAVPIPAGVLRAALAASCRLGIGQYGPEQVDFLAHRPVLGNQHLIDDSLFTPARTSAQVLAEFAQSRRHRPR